MSNFKHIQSKLEAFISRFYTNELIKGAILFFAIGLLYFLLTLFIESVLWLNTTARTILFWLFVLVEIVLLVKFIFLPLAKLFKLQKGINYEEASIIIGKHFPEVSDKLLNVLQLKQSESESELLLASIEQKSLELNPVPFKLAINFKENISYLKYAAIPVLILVIIAITGNANWFSDSYKRVTNYKTAYEPPAPFQFFVVNDSLNAIENKDFKLVVKTAGKVTPESAQIEYNGETYFLQQKGLGAFEYVFSQPKSNIEFKLFANAVISKPYKLNVIEVPSLLSFDMFLNYPKHTKRKDEVLKGSGNALVPEGTKVTWKLKTKSTSQVYLFAKDTLAFISSKKDVFEAKKSLFSNLDYEVSTSNSRLKNYENLAFSIDVVKDEFPELNVTMKVDSLDLQSLYFHGQVSDDYGLSKLELVYYPTNKENEKQIEAIKLTNSNVSEFITAFPNNLNIKAGVSYNLYFQVFDNDVVNKFKQVKSSVFTYKKRTATEEKEKQLKEQNETIKDLNKSLKKFNEQEKQLVQLSKNQKEKKNLDFNDQKKMKSFFKRQKEQDEMMKNFNKKLKENLKQFEKDNPKDDQFKKDLQKRLQENEEQLKKDEKLLEQLEKITDKINKEELGKKLEELGKQNKNKKRSLQQLLELTKRFYVEKKLEKLKDDLEKLAEDQEKLSNQSEENNTKEKQDSLNKSFDDFKKSIEDLEKDNKALKKPLEIPRDKIDEKEIDLEQNKASENLNKEVSQTEEKKKENHSKAEKNQKKAAKKMKEMSKKMSASMSASGGEQMQEDMDMLRQVLDNLVLFSFDQEALMDQFNAIDVNHNKYASYLKKQYNLKEHFEHIDDSLFALSLRQPKLSETVNKEITEVYFNMDEAMKVLADNQLYYGISKQQFATTAANNLSSFLSDVLDNMQESMSMSKGKGQGEEQLPDIIMSQEELNKMMEKGMKKGEKGKPNKEGGKEKGESEKDGDAGKDKNKGKSSKKGDNGEQNTEGENGSKQGEGLGEQNSEELYKIYQKQQELREALQKRLEKEGFGNKGGKLVRQMEEIELDLLNKGFTEQTLQKMMNLKHQLIKLENATFQQGKDKKRESETNNNQFDNNAKNQIPKAKQYFKTTEILNRQALPLRPIYKKKVQTYFKNTDD
ncbi:ATPase [Postechiella marina]|uniref:ATPase n=1 Tax=Postechiella marina TaxID=943941 RepID=A0ABP8C5F5_9FLAO